MSPQDPPPTAPPEPAPQQTPDRFSAALGNATLLGIGYLLMRRPRLAVMSLIGSIALVALVAVYPHVVVWRLLLLLWWTALTLHAWRSAHRTAPGLSLARGGWNPLWRRRVLTAACVLLATLVWFRFDAWTIVGDAEAAHADGDCDRAVDSLRWLGPLHHAAYGSATERGEEQEEACELLITALAEPFPADAAEKLERYLDRSDDLWDGAGPKRAEFLLDAALQGEKEVLEDDGPVLTTVEHAFKQLSASLQETTGQSERVRGIVDSFVAELGEVPACKATAIDQWLLDQTWKAPELSEPVAPEADKIPGRMYRCADALSGSSPDKAGAAYQDFLVAYPEHELAADAADGLLTNQLYCEHPAAYPGAPAYKGSGPHAMRTFGISAHQYEFPDSWQAGSADKTVLVTCVKGPERGSHQQTCYYDPGENQSLHPFQESAKVDFYASKFTVKAYSLKTGELVEDYSEEVGDPCPSVLEYETYGYFDSVPSEYDADYSNADVRGIFDRLMN